MEKYTIYKHHAKIDNCSYSINFYANDIYIICHSIDVDLFFPIADHKVDWEYNKFNDGSFFGDLIPQELKDHIHCVLLCIKHNLDPKTHLEKVMMLGDKDIEKYLPLL